jgi:hypothetical protein
MPRLRQIDAEAARTGISPRCAHPALLACKDCSAEWTSEAPEIVRKEFDIKELDIKS